MNVANLELCKELFKLSGWPVGIHLGEWEDLTPQYDLGFLLRKLPPVVTLKSRAGGRWSCSILTGRINGKTIEKIELDKLANTPENAACKLAIELFKQGVVKL